MSPLIQGSQIGPLSVDDRVGKATLRFFLADPSDVEVHDTVVVRDADTPANKYFSGYILSKAIKREKANAFIVTTDCASTAWRMANPPTLCTKVYQDTDDQDIILDAITECGLGSVITASTSTVDTIETGLDVAFRERTLTEVLDEMTAASGGVWDVDASDTLSYNASASAASAAWDINQDSPNGSTTFAVDITSASENFETPATTAVVLGAIKDGVQIRATATTAGSPTLTFTRPFESPLIVSEATAQAVADAIIADGEAKRVSIKFRYTDEGGLAPLSQNTLIDVTASELGLSAETMLIRSVSMYQETGTTTRFTIDAGGYAPSAAELLRKIGLAGRRQQQSLPFFFPGYDFTAANDEYVVVPSHSSIDDLSPLTVSMWVLFDSVSSNQSLIVKGLHTGSGQWRIELNGTSKKIEARRVYSSSNSNLTSTSVLTAGTLYHIAATWTSGGVGTLYINGEAEDTDSGSGSVTTEATYDIEIGTNLSADAAGESTKSFDGFISQVRIWGGVIPPNLMSRLAAKPGAEDALWSGDQVLHLRMDEYGSGDTVLVDSTRDSSAAMNHGTINAFKTLTGRETVWQ